MLYYLPWHLRASLVSSAGKEFTCNAGNLGLIPGLGRSPGAGHLPGKCHGQRSLVGYSPWGHKESDMTEVV